MTAAPPVEAIAITIAVLLLALSIMFARAVRGTGPSRARRILLPAILFTLGTTLVLALPQLFIGTPIYPLRAVGMGLLWLFLIGLASAAIADSVAAIMGAERTPRWLTAGIVAAILLTYGGLALLTGDLIFRPEPFALVPALVAASAAISWWPYLPRAEGEEDEEDAEAAEVFE